MFARIQITLTIIKSYSVTTVKPMKLSTGRSIMIIIILLIIKLTEAYPLSIKIIKKEVDYVCSRSVRNKNNIKRVSAQTL